VKGFDGNDVIASADGCGLLRLTDHCPPDTGNKLHSCWQVFCAKVKSSNMWDSSIMYGGLL
jgi:hypothetical protein